MKYFAKLDSNNIVLEVHVIHDRDAPTEEQGIEFLSNWNNHPFWVQCSKDGSIRKNGAGKGMTYDADKDGFIAEQPYASWTLNASTCNWEPPVAPPEDGVNLKWCEDTMNWEEIT